MGELKHYSHEHKLILNAAEPILYKKGVCVVCVKPVHEMLDMFYRCATTPTTSGSSCAGFFLHKTCAELPSTFTHPAKPQHLLTLTEFPLKKHQFLFCHVCQGSFRGSVYALSGQDFDVCVKCVISALKSLEERSRCHPSHSHPLTLIQNPSFFLCHACNTAATDLSYVCTKCWFWIHQSCANAPTTYQCRFHKEHSLVLDYSLPQKYRNFTQFCGVCEKYIKQVHWVYYCANCRFFAHVNCALSVDMLSGNEINPADPEEFHLMHFPAPDEESLNKMMQQCVTTMATIGALPTDGSVLHNNAIVEKPSPYINHRGIHYHQLVLRSRNTNTSTHDLNQELAHNELLICDWCTKPISLIDDIIYDCNLCDYVLHRSCALFPGKIQHHLVGNLNGQIGVYYQRFRCKGCGILSNGMVMSRGRVGFDIGCASLPRIIKHEAHRHHLIQLKYQNHFGCKACGLQFDARVRELIIYGCEKCEFYMHIRCMLKPHKVKQRWDPHPLYLILFPKDVADHPHEYECEFCSEQIDTNHWFYHCNICDLSFHIYCIDPYWYHSNTKFGATGKTLTPHPCSHGLTFVLDKKKRRCKICNLDTWSSPVLECSPCKFVVHTWCAALD